MISIDRKLGETWDFLAADNGDAYWRVDHLNSAADLFLRLADSGEGQPEADLLTAKILTAVAIADQVATGALAWRPDFIALPDQVAEVLDRMASEPVLTRRALLLEDLWRAIPDDGAAEVIACLPYAPDMVGWRHEEKLPSTVSFRSFLKVVGVVWRSRRAA